MEIRDKVVIREKGESAAIPSKDLLATLRWRKAVDLDLWCFYRTKEGNDGLISFGNKGDINISPFIQLDKDSGVGDQGGANEENIRFKSLDVLEHAYICANIYGKENSNFASYDGAVVVSSGDKSFEVPLSSRDKGNWCVVAHFDNSSPITPKLENVNVTLRDRPTTPDLVSGNFKQHEPLTSKSGSSFLGRIFGK